ncbi:hypothetical protein [Streptomyces sp. G-G2]|uniref:hypothetical protein n=1 Tax=Streptomyces sp. G-G2 TaxID=3046201 RepID=UPI0024BA7ECE|nr:hypothetical protein [Streptomyces sp. G-G2]MDJ0381320.1 hypothetical protein [Streptomyces sp. G-G2]
MYERLPTSGPARPSASEANEAIRHLVEIGVADDWPSEAYEFLLGEWAAGSREEVGSAVP